MRAVWEGGYTRWETDVEPHNAGGDAWYPARVQTTGYDVTNNDAVVGQRWLDITAFYANASISDDTIVAVPSKGNPFYAELRSWADSQEARP